MPIAPGSAGGPPGRARGYARVPWLLPFAATRFGTLKAGAVAAAVCSHALRNAQGSAASIRHRTSAGGSGPHGPARRWEAALLLQARPWRARPAVNKVQDRATHPRCHASARGAMLLRVAEGHAHSPRLCRGAPGQSPGLCAVRPWAIAPGSAGGPSTAVRHEAVATAAPGAAAGQLQPTADEPQRAQSTRRETTEEAEQCRSRRCLPSLLPSVSFVPSVVEVSSSSLRVLRDLCGESQFRGPLRSASRPPASGRCC